MFCGAALLLSAVMPEASAETSSAAKVAAISVAEAQAGCPALLGVTDPDETCRPAGFGKIGTVGGHALVFALYDYTPSGARTAQYSRVVVFERAGPGQLRAAVAPAPDIGTHFEKPKLLRSGGRLVLHIPGYEPGTGNFNRERLYLWRGGRWRDVDVIAWLTDLAHRVPPGYGAWKGIYPDYVRMTATTLLWRDRDGNACPTGGRADLGLGWRGDRIVLRSIHRRRAGECGEPLARRGHPDE